MLRLEAASYSHLRLGNGGGRGGSRVYSQTQFPLCGHLQGLDSRVCPADRHRRPQGQGQGQGSPPDKKLGTRACPLCTSSSGPRSS